MRNQARGQEDRASLNGEYSSAERCEAQCFGVIAGRRRLGSEGKGARGRDCCCRCARRDCSHSVWKELPTAQQERIERSRQREKDAMKEKSAFVSKNDGSGIPAEMQYVVVFLFAG